MKIYGYVIGQYFYNVDSPSLSKEMLDRAIAVVRADAVLPQANVIKSVCDDELRAECKARGYVMKRDTDGFDD